MKVQPLDRPHSILKQYTLRRWASTWLSSTPRRNLFHNMRKSHPLSPLHVERKERAPAVRTLPRSSVNWRPGATLWTNRARISKCGKSWTLTRRQRFCLASDLSLNLLGSVVVLLNIAPSNVWTLSMWPFQPWNASWNEISPGPGCPSAKTLSTMTNTRLKCENSLRITTAWMRMERRFDLQSCLSYRNPSIQSYCWTSLGILLSRGSAANCWTRTSGTLCEPWWRCSIRRNTRYFNRRQREKVRNSFGHKQPSNWPWWAGFMLPQISGSTSFSMKS